MAEAQPPALLRLAQAKPGHAFRATKMVSKPQSRLKETPRGRKGGGRSYALSPNLIALDSFERCELSLSEVKLSLVSKRLILQTNCV